MPGPPRGPFVPDDDDVTRLDGLTLDRVEALLFAVEHARRAAMLGALGARQLQHSAFGREVAEENDEAAVRFQRMARSDGRLAAPVSPIASRGVLGQRASGDRQARRQPHGPASIKPLHHERAAAGGVQIGGDEPARRLEVGDERRARR